MSSSASKIEGGGDECLEGEGKSISYLTAALGLHREDKDDHHGAAQRVLQPRPQDDMSVFVLTAGILSLCYSIRFRLKLLD